MWWYQSIHPLWNMGFGISSCVFTAKWTSCAQEAKPLEWSVVPHRAAESWNELAYDSEYVWHIWHELNLLTHVVAFYVLPFLTTGGTFCGSWEDAPARAGGKVRKNTGFRHSAIDWFPMNRGIALHVRQINPSIQIRGCFLQDPCWQWQFRPELH